MSEVSNWDGRDNTAVAWADLALFKPSDETHYVIAPALEGWDQERLVRDCAESGWGVPTRFPRRRSEGGTVSSTHAGHEAKARGRSVYE